MSRVLVFVGSALFALCSSAASIYWHVPPSITNIAGRILYQPTEATLNSTHDFRALAWSTGSIADIPTAPGWNASPYSLFLPPTSLNSRVRQNAVLGSSIVQLQNEPGTSSSEGAIRLNAATATDMGPANNYTLTVQFNRWWTPGTGPHAWDQTSWGQPWSYSTAVTIGATVAIPEFSLPSHTGVCASTLYIRGRDISTGQRYWIQASMFDSLGPSAQVLYRDPFTGDVAYSGQIRPGGSSYWTINPSSWYFTSTPFSAFRFYSVTISRQQLWNLITAFNAQLGTTMTPEPGWHEIFAAGVTPECGANTAKDAIMAFEQKGFFLRSEY